MSWRRFLVLLRCLSPNSATVTRIQGDRYLGRKGEKENTVVGAKATEQAFQSMFKDVGAKKRARHVGPGQAHD